MKITIVGAGPVGLLLACFLSRYHQITILEKRTQFVRHHVLSIHSETRIKIREFLGSDLPELDSILNFDQSDTQLTTSWLQEQLMRLALSRGVIIRMGVEISSLEEITDRIVIGADGSHSQVRTWMLHPRVTTIEDEHTVQYMAQLKFKTPLTTRPRSKILSTVHTFLNGISGDDIVTTFESLSSADTSEISIRKSATLHIPIPEAGYRFLSRDGRGNYAAPWTLSELNAILSDPTTPIAVSKLVRVLNRYRFGLTLRNGWMEQERLTVLPLTMYSSVEVYRMIDHPTHSKLVLLCGDSAMGLIYQQGLNAGWLLAIACAQTLREIRGDKLEQRLHQYRKYWKELYRQERERAMQKGRKISLAHVGTSMVSQTVASAIIKRIYSNSEPVQSQCFSGNYHNP